jgi:hypothetical protein
MSLHRIALIIYVFRCINAFHIHSPIVHVHNRMSTCGRVTQSSQPPSMCRGVGVVNDEPDDPDKPSIFLDLDCGVRISRIMEASTDSFDVMQKLCRAKGRTDIMRIALLRHRRKCMLVEYDRISEGSDDNMYTGWSYEHRPGSAIRSTSGTSSSTLWVIDERSFHRGEVRVGSWLLASVHKDQNHLSALFSRTMSRTDEARPVSLVMPGFAYIPLVHTPEGPRWVATFVELGNFDELGTPVKAKKTKLNPR